MDNYQRFLELHSRDKALLIGNVWNVQSAKVFEELNFEAIATSSAAVAESLGYADGENMSFDEYLFIIRRIAASSPLPLSVDLEMGYADTVDAIVKNLLALIDLGVVGINIEDSKITDGKRSLVAAEPFAEKIRSIRARLDAASKKLYINVRTDAFLLRLPDALAESLKRIELYKNSGASGLFFPCITKESDIEAIVKASPLPVHVMYMPDLPAFETLDALGVKRISMANFMYGIAYAQLKAITQKHLDEGKFTM